MPKVSKKTVYDVDPDYIYGGDSITFVYDPQDDKLHWDHYPMTHRDIMKGPDDDYALGNKIDPDWEPDFGSDSGPGRDAGLRAGAVLGRVGRHNDTTIISYWNDDGYDSPPIDKGELAHVTKKVMAEIPYDYKKVYVVTRENPQKGGKAYTLRDLGIGKKTTRKNTETPQQAISPDCQPTISVAGEEMDLGTVLGNLHMVRGPRMDQMKSAFCSDYASLRQSMLAKGCNTGILDDIARRMKCNADDAYQRSLEAGKRIYRQELRDKFGSLDDTRPYPGSVYFPTQSRLDKDWDYLRGFKEWLAAQEAHL